MNSESPTFPVPDAIPVSDAAAPVWFRRALKACASCRRDKIRCDGGRPCGGCTKKGYALEQCIDGCEPCRRARDRCEGGKPCTRCTFMKIECLDEPSAGPLRHDPEPAPARSPRPGGDRVKSACQNCRRDNKKCEDQRPCGRCVARSEECIHVGRGPKLVKLRCEGCRQNNKRCEDGRPCEQCVEAGRECVTSPRKGRGHGTRVKAACTNCRRDKIRCDGVRPCVHCTRKGYDCVEPACKPCSRSGKAAECLHRWPHNGEALVESSGPSSSHEASTSQLPSPSHEPAMHHEMPSNREISPPQPPQQHLPHLPPMNVPMYNSQNFWYPPQYPLMHPSHPPGYYPVIDPSIMAAERQEDFRDGR